MNPLNLPVFDYVMHWEDDGLTTKVTEDQGGKTRLGISQRANPDLTDTNFYQLEPRYAIEKAKELYEQRYFDKVRTELITDQRIRCKIADMQVSMGTEGILIAQNAVGVKQDGGVGDITLRGWNSSQPDALLYRLATLSLAWYNKIEGSENEHKSWERRARALGDLVNVMKL
jgi:lysozyme family protein